MSRKPQQEKRALETAPDGGHGGAPGGGERAGAPGHLSRRAFAAKLASLGLSAAAVPAAVGTALAGQPGEEPKRRRMGATRGMVVAPQPLASEAGAEIFLKGGNAVDAAIATAFVQGIVTPFSAGVGGFGCMLIYSVKERRTVMVDFHGRAGDQASPDVYASAYEGRIYGHADRSKIRGDINQIGHKSVVTPGTPAGLYQAWQLYGSLPWADLIAPAIRLAEEGFELTGTLGSMGTTSRDGVVPFWTKIRTTDASAKIFLKGGNSLWQAGDILVQRDYARTLQRIAEMGPDVFYRGEIAEKIVEDFRKNGGFITREDLENYRADVYEPVRGTYRGYEIASNPLPGSGPQVIQILHILEGYDLGDLEHTSFRNVEIVARAQRLTFFDRVAYHGDPKFIDDPTELLLSKSRAAELRRYIDRREFPGPLRVTRPEDGTTTLSSVDEDGNCVALTHTLGSASGTVTPGLGFTYNNCMFQFNPVPGFPNSIAPGKARITGISPTIVFRRGHPILVHGAAGGTRILGAVQHAINNVVDHGMSVVEALYAPRWHWEDHTLDTETRLYFKHKDAFKALGIDMTYHTGLARLQAIMIDPRTGRLSGANDPGGGFGGVSTV